MSEDLSKYASLVFVLIFFFELLFCTDPVGEKSSATGNSTISNQLLAGSIMVRHIKSISDPSLPLRVNGQIKSKHRNSQGVSTTSFGGSFPYFHFFSFIDLTRFAGFDVISDIFSYIFPIHCRPQRFFQEGMS